LLLVLSVFSLQRVLKFDNASHREIKIWS